MPAFDTPKTAAMRNFLKKEKGRVTGLSIEPDGVFIYTDSEQWQDDAGAGTWREDSETAAIKDFYSTVQPGVKNKVRGKNPKKKRTTHKGTYYFPDYSDAREYAEANNFPTDRIISYGRGWAIQLRVSGAYVGPDTGKTGAVCPRCKKKTFVRQSTGGAACYECDFGQLRPGQKGYKKNPIELDEYIYQLSRISHSRDYLSIDQKQAKGILLALKKLQSEYTAAPSKFQKYEQLSRLEGEAYRIIDRAEYNKSLRKNPVKKYFQLYDVANDYSLSPVPGKYQFGDLKHAKQRAQELVDKWVAGMTTRAGKLSDYKIKWQRNPVAGSRDSKMEWIGTIHDYETVYRIIERRKNPVKKKTRKGNPDRITQDWLKKRISLVNDMLGRPESAYTQKAGGGMTGNRGHLFIDFAYGGVKVAEMAGNGTGENNISDGYVSKPELNNFINGMIAAVRLAEQKPRKKRAKKNPRKAKEWQIFKCRGNDVRFLGTMTSGEGRWFTTRGDGIKTDSKVMAVRMAKAWSHSDDWKYGITPVSKSLKQIIASCTKKGKV